MRWFKDKFYFCYALRFYNLRERGPFDIFHARFMELKTFFIYTLTDEYLAEELLRRLQPLLRKGLLSICLDGKAGPGEDWGETAKEELRGSDLVLMLVSDALIRSDFFRGQELSILLDRYRERSWKGFVPILARECGWQSEDRLRGFRLLPCFREDGPQALTGNNPGKNDLAWATLADQIEELAKALLQGDNRAGIPQAGWQLQLEQVEADAAKKRILRNYKLRGELLEKILLEDDPVRKMKFELDVKRMEENIERDKQLLDALQR